MRKDLLGNNERPFNVPANYFEELEEKLKGRIGAEESRGKKETVFAPVISIVKPWLAMAAGFLVIGLIYYQVPQIFSDQKDSATVESMSEDELINSIALIVDENEINELMMSEDSAYLLPVDSILIGSFTEEELAALTYFD